MSSTEDIASLRAELSDLKERVRVLEQLTAARAEGSPSTVVPVTVTYHSAATDSPSAAPPAVTVGSPTQLPGTPVGLTPGGRITASQYTEEYRRDIALGIGDYLRRSLQGVNRGPSGRQQISLPSKVYILVRDLNGRTYDPVGVHHTFSSLRHLVRDGDYLGDSIFIGLPSLWEAKLAVQCAGLSWPA